MNPDPVLYMLDEPFAGLTQAEINSYLSLMRERREKGSTFLLVEHNMRAVMGICDRIVVLDHGEKIAEGNPEEIQANRRVMEAYLGHDGIA
jgi:ABC-type branched-subunit amino acid transport system ATPase component